MLIYYLFHNAKLNVRITLFFLHLSLKLYNCIRNNNLEYTNVFWTLVLFKLTYSIP